jgi:hypothetical protein
MVRCGAFVVNCVAGRGTKFGTKKVPIFLNYFLLSLRRLMQVVQGYLHRLFSKIFRILDDDLQRTSTRRM